MGTSNITPSSVVPPSPTGEEDFNFAELGHADADQPGEGEQVSAEAAPVVPAKPASPGGQVEGQPSTTPATVPPGQVPAASQAPVPSPIQTSPIQQPGAQPQPQPSQPAAPTAPSGQATSPAPATAPAAQAQPPAAWNPQQYQQMRDHARGQIAAKYTLTEEQASQLATEPEKVLPQLAAGIFMDAYEAVYMTMLSQLPRLIAGYQQHTEQSSGIREKFFQAWPQLKAPQYQEQVAKVAATFQQMNPQATIEEQIQGVGAMASYLLGLGGQPAAPAAQPPQPGPVAVPRPHTPAGAGASGMAPAPGGANDFWAQFAHETEELGR